MGDGAFEIKYRIQESPTDSPEELVGNIEFSVSCRVYYKTLVPSGFFKMFRHGNKQLAAYLCSNCIPTSKY